MVTKPRSREDHRGWFSILRQGKKSFIEALQNQEKERNPLETDNEDRCNMIAWEAIKKYINSDQFGMMLRRDFNTYDKDKFGKRTQIIKIKRLRQILQEMLIGSEVPEINWKNAENELFNSIHLTNSDRLKQLLTDLERFLDELEFRDNYFAVIRQWFSACLTQGPLSSNIDINHRHNKWYKLKPDRKTTSMKPQEDAKSDKGNRLKPGETNVKTWEEWNDYFNTLADRVAQKARDWDEDKYSASSMNK